MERTKEISKGITKEVTETAEDVHSMYQVEIDQLTRLIHELHEMLDVGGVKVPVGYITPQPSLSPRVATGGSKDPELLTRGKAVERRVEVMTLMQEFGEYLQDKKSSDTVLADHLNDGWEVMDIVSNVFRQKKGHSYSRMVTLKREAPQPKVASPNGQGEKKTAPATSEQKETPDKNKPVSVVEKNPDNPGDGETVVEFDTPLNPPVVTGGVVSADTLREIARKATTCGRHVPEIFTPIKKVQTGIVVRKGINEVTFEEAMAPGAGYSRKEVEAIGNREFVQQLFGTTEKVRINTDLELERIS